MNKIYFIFECDPGRSIASYCIKLATSNMRYAKEFFQENRYTYSNNDWSLNLASYDPAISSIDWNIYKDFILLETTENN